MDGSMNERRRISSESEKNGMDDGSCIERCFAHIHVNFRCFPIMKNHREYSMLTHLISSLDIHPNCRSYDRL